MSRIKLPTPHAHTQPTNGSTRSNGLLDAKLPDDYTNLALEADNTIRLLTTRRPKTARMYSLLASDIHANALWNLSNYLTVGKLNYNDHGPIHARVTAAYAMQFMTLLSEHDVPFDVVKSGAGDLDDTFLVVLAGIMLHDIGNALHREGHEAMGVVLAQPILDRMLPQIYADVEQRHIIATFVSSCIQCHDIRPAPLYMEGAVVAVADGCDMTKGRARMPFDLGKIDIHAISALSIEDVSIRPCNDCGVPVQIEVQMSNSAGIFQVEETLVKKLLVTPLKNYVTVKASTIDPRSQNDKRIIQSVTLRHGRLTPT
jgi:hypothetical protein